MRLNCAEENGVSLVERTSQSIARIARTVGDLAISRAFLRAVLTAIITREGGFTDRHRKYRPPSYPDICRSFSLPPVAAVGAGDGLRDSPLRGKYPQRKMH
jgi:hypothetical protein